MKWLFATLVALNIVVFASILGYKLIDKRLPVNQPVAVQPANTQQQLPPQVIINTGAPVAIPAQTNGSSRGTNEGSRSSQGASSAQANNNRTVLASPRYKPCSARISMPEDDYHRIKGLLARFSHVATREVMANPTSGQAENKMNVLFMSVSNQDVGSLRNIVGRYGQLSHEPCSN